MSYRIASSGRNTPPSFSFVRIASIDLIGLLVPKHESIDPTPPDTIRKGGASSYWSCLGSGARSSAPSHDAGPRHGRSILLQAIRRRKILADFLEILVGLTS